MTTSRVHKILRKRATAAMLGNESTVKLQPSQVLMLLDIIDELEAQAATGREILTESPAPAVP
jgi:hypothetical protein